MRRADREITDANKIDKIIMKCDCCRLGFLEEGGAYILPLNFGYTNESGTRTFYFHGAKEGKKIRLILTQPHVGFELDGNHKLNKGETAQQFSLRFQSVMGKGHVTMINDLAEKLAGLELIMEHYTGKNGWSIPEKVVENTAVYKCCPAH
jgi:nitroimidazol reductase NimA-like FMN-containing flavoprotein (pyridoxamine 5'-phosphate oxidase superfamily)